MKHAIKVLNIVGIPGVCRRIRPIDDGTISIWTRLSVLTNYFFRFYVCSIFSYPIAAFPCATRVSHLFLLPLAINYCKLMLHLLGYMLRFLLRLNRVDLILTYAH